MPLKVADGDAFPSISLVDDRESEVTIENVGGYQL